MRKKPKTRPIRVTAETFRELQRLASTEEHRGRSRQVLLAMAVDLLTDRAAEKEKTWL
ncbi:hypothetical protein LCGC14_1604680 [marine sediment metagenome]|uniref:Ribbon-helix-helix protein CopG domain-containing protein n=1 Tax=marine sediment metagenome TaxID=412755 RepID=A0A0F9KQV5_9ZZZZ